MCFAWYCEEFNDCANQDYPYKKKPKKKISLSIFELVCFPASVQFYILYSYFTEIYIYNCFLHYDKYAKIKFLEDYRWSPQILGSF